MRAFDHLAMGEPGSNEAATYGAPINKKMQMIAKTSS
jgi:hypothetical protein